MTEEAKSIVCDTGPIIHLDELGCLDLLTDDASARMVAERMGFRVHGTIGIIVRAIRRGWKSPAEVLSIIGSIPSRSTLFIKSSLLKEIATRIRKEFDL